ncbi:hypothetical protein EKO04_005162 [Ascochyta lentis]|uniref:Urea active transporter n=1 Tax=Ascochyta lentis TaxID=205686 RepID=A0A8H7J1R6_9PLEO|nr:hypothetical protein EKO04_005162 [Ascochyta lentis]
MSQTRLPVFNEGVGYGLVLGLGALFALGMSLISVLLARYMAEIQTSEMYMTAKHSVKTGLVASAVVSSWTIAATLLTSTTEGYLYGVSGPFWYGAGATVQIFMFAVAAIELKRKAPNAHTFLEVVRVRYGRAAHIVLGCYSLFYQIFTTVNLLVGGSTLFSQLTGMNRDGCCFLLPLGVICYTLFGGIKATFLTDWAHTVVIYVIMLLCIFVAYVTSDVVGSPSRMYELLNKAAKLHPVAGNEGGSYVTMRSENGGYIGLIFIGAGFAAAVDSQLFQKAIAADPTATLPGYMLGGLCWFTIPFVLASTFGLAAAATEHLPSFPTYPNRMTSEQVSSGMAMPFAAMALMGNGGALAVLIMAFMAVTSAMSSETVATAALVTYDIYKAYINPDASSKQLVRVSHSVVIAFGLIIPCIAVGFNHAGFSVNYPITAIGIFVDSAIVPMACVILWKDQSRAAVILTPLIGSATAITAWLVVAYTQVGEVTIASTSTVYPLVAGNMISLCFPLILCPVISLFQRQNFDWEILKQLKSDRGAALDELQAKGGPVIEGQPVVERTASVLLHSNAETSEQEKEEEAMRLDARLKKAGLKALAMAIALCLAFLILWPIPMYGSRYIFSEKFFTGWIVVVFLWAFFAAIAITCTPIWEGRKDIARFFAFVFGVNRKMRGDASAETTTSEKQVQEMNVTSEEKK